MNVYNNVYCNVCGVHYNAARMHHVCDPHDLELIFLEEIDQPEACSLNGDNLRNIKFEIEENGNPPHLVAMWEKSAGRPYDD